MEPPRSQWEFALDRAAPREDLVGVGADLAPGTLLAAYRSGLFPMGLGRGGRGRLGWWSPDPRGIIPLPGLRVSRSLRASFRRFRITVDAAFDTVVDACADTRRSGAWITPAVAAAYRELHRLGWAHSVEAWLPDGRLAGGLYGVAVAGLFAGESMFHASWPQARDASKVALVGLVEAMRADGDPRRLLDVQWCTTHLATLGCVEVSRDGYMGLLREALKAPLPAAFAGRAPYDESSHPLEGTHAVLE